MRIVPLVRLAAAAAFVLSAATPAHADDFGALARHCAPRVDPHTLAAIVSVESGYNPYAIGVVGAHLARQPTTLAEARATVDMLTRLGYNFSLGLAQVNRYNLARFHETVLSIFEPCTNLRVAASILTECFARAAHAENDEQFALRKALSCFYSGNFSTGFGAGYVGRVVAHALDDITREVAPISLAPNDRGRRRPSAAGEVTAAIDQDARQLVRAPTASVASETARGRVSRCAPGVVVLSDCVNDALPNKGTVTILR